ncbi:L-asparaginase/archaeal Glu-tRNAGln amidotransferase subunit D [Halalkaliarchaeum sp. AArc-CO]|uniref:asparaginase n=1 Tax=unclassified Halalkaliarchaeum TaxID=2678344 RepID=UPI00217E226E|nr:MULTISPECIES: asparaginase [unclassified Halalkaliarchaeum]MDR5671547.1 asparaginase [Halalkaliarchaeum sp. AArc-GB]UWG51047.1 L-asparaginase/archaeal Glu-tRNAGln amidotransferase subunit D [Halalkaliarchaeum sp. AArc-CO]
MTTPTLAVLSCGGTIAAEPDDDGAAPAKSGEQLLGSVPALEGRAEFEIHEVCSQPGFDMRWRDVTAAAELAEAVQSSADGIVLTHGTDTLADTAYALELLEDLPIPVIVTGAQRRLDETSSDAPANLLSAVRAAADDRFAAGVHVAFDQEIHAARDVVKGHTSALDTFRSPGKGPVATLSRSDVRIHRTPQRRANVPPLGAVAPETIPRVPIVHSGTGVGAEELNRLIQADGASDEGASENGHPVGGVVIEGTGLGNVSGALGEAIASVSEELPVVVGTRCYAGATEPVYGTPGGAVTLSEAGVAFAGDLSTAKARVKLALGLAADVDVEMLFAD